MDRLTTAERVNAAKIILAEAPDLSLAQAKAFIDKVEPWAIALHTLYETRCNRPMTTAEERSEEALEAGLRLAFKDAGLGLYLNSDPRGSPVGILTPKTGRYNTMGGRECGWRL